MKRLPFWTLAFFIAAMNAPLAAEEPEAVYRRGVRLLLKGGGIEDRKLALACFRQATEAGHGPAANWLAAMVSSGYGVVPIDLKEYVRLIRLSADAGYPPAMFRLSGILGKGEYSQVKDEEAGKRLQEKALPGIRELAASGDAHAQLILGVIYARGAGVTQDQAEALKWYRKAADQGHAGAQRNVGGMYETGRGVARDVNEAVKWYRRAADQGHVDGQFYLGVMYAKGLGVAKSDEEAVKWTLKAAEQGDALSQYSIGVKYHIGRGVEKDQAEAIKWVRKSAAQGFEVAKVVLQQWNADP